METQHETDLELRYRITRALLAGRSRELEEAFKQIDRLRADNDELRAIIQREINDR